MFKALHDWLKRLVAGEELATLEAYRINVAEVERWFCSYVPEVARVAGWIRAYSEFDGDPQWNAFGEHIGTLRSSIVDERAQMLASARQITDAELLLKLCQLMKRRPDMVAHIREALADAAPVASPWPPGLLERVKAAEQRFRDRAFSMRVPADPTDIDLVLAEVRLAIERKPAPCWIKPTNPNA